MEKTIKKIDIWTIFMYLIIYSIAGFLIETIFGALTKGVIESRKSFLYGPFCAIYGIGAITMILFLKNQKNIWKLFFCGAILGAIVEYSMSYFCELFFGVKWWDYSKAWLNIGGRTCIGYAIAWGLLAILLIKYVNPRVDNWIDIISKKENTFKVAMILLIAFFSIDAILTSSAIKMFYYRIATENNLNITDKKMVQSKYDIIKKRTDLFSSINKYYDNEKMLKTYPNIMVSEKNNNNIYVENLLTDVKSYYYKLGDAF